MTLKLQTQLIFTGFSRITGIVSSAIILGLMIGCSSGGGGDSPAEVIVVASNSNNNANATTAPIADDSGNATGSSSEGASADSGDSSAEGGTTESIPSSTTTAGSPTDSGSTADGADSPSGETTVSTATAGSETAGTTSDGGLDSTTADGVTTGTSTDSGVTSAGAETDTAGNTTDGGLDSAGTSTDEGATAGTATDAGTAAGTTTDEGTTGETTTDAGTTAGSTTDADTTAGTTTDAGTTTGSTTAGTTSYPVGSLAYLLANQADLSLALVALQEANIDEAINSSINEWTLFLPTNEAIEALDSQADFDLAKHRSAGIFSLADLSGFNGLGLKMDDERALIIDGGGAEAVTVADATVIRGDITGNTGLSTVHVIDTVIGEYTGPEYPSGSLADKLVNKGDMSIVLNLLKADKGSDIMLVDPGFEWTLFLPNDLALEGVQDSFVGDNHIYGSAVLKSTNLTGLIGTSIEMFGGNLFEIGGGGTEPLTIGGFNIIDTDLRNDAMEGVVVHIIDGVLVPE